MKPLEYYQKLIESDQILPDPQQAAVIQKFDEIYDQLMLQQQPSKFLSKLISRKKLPVKGLYLYGEVGVGKTLMMDCFFYCVPFKAKMRIHFHKFMKLIHDQLRELKSEQQPLKKIARTIAKDCRLICFDELIVNDITDAMLLAGLFEALYDEGICLIFTGNTAPDNLYLKGIQRESFLPAIQVIKKNSEIFPILSSEDYRLKHYTANSYYFSPLDLEAEKQLEAQFLKWSNNQAVSNHPLEIYDRKIVVKKKADGAVWFEFLDICGIPRSQQDYLALVENFHTILISNVKVIQFEQNDLARAFINLVDVIYDSKKRLILSAEKPIEQIYTCGKLLFEFARTRSRIIEMQTASWQKKVIR